jgi:hypothetical protein
MKRDSRLAPLSREHTQALMLALEIERTPRYPEKQLSALFSRLIAFWSAGLLPHFTAEGECLLARLIRHLPDDDERVRRLQRDHLRMEAFVASMRDTSDIEARRILMLEFGETLRGHVRWEEEHLFPATEAMLSDEELTALGVDLKGRLPMPPRAF